MSVASLLSTLLAETKDPSIKDVVLVGGLLLGVVIIGFIAIYFARRYTQRDRPASGEAFTLHDLRVLHADGRITDDEFEKARGAMIGRVTAEHSAEELSGRSTGDARLAAGGPDNETGVSRENAPKTEEPPAERPDQID